MLEVTHEAPWPCQCWEHRDPVAGTEASVSRRLQASYTVTEDHGMSVSDLEPGGSPPGCSLPDLASSASAGAVPSVTLGCCHLAGAQISPQGVEHGFGLLSGQIKAVSRASGREPGLQISISDMPHHSPSLLCQLSTCQRLFVPL